ncbi:uncharacterized protein LOC132197485 [Neocloeon triangulifer]|uniref:uncharacterized protein LOC132197485 n=1 Tax=Neocloeon triangulifer TaxID=2078957 RepID=UPI00286F8457|nr:uncharacterized protein LOC132197485 [Neocloeon triangulifer]
MALVLVIGHLLFIWSLRVDAQNVAACTARTDPKVLNETWCTINNGIKRSGELRVEGTWVHLAVKGEVNDKRNCTFRLKIALERMTNVTDEAACVKLHPDTAPHDKFNEWIVVVRPTAGGAFDAAAALPVPMGCYSADFDFLTSTGVVGAFVRSKPNVFVRTHGLTSHLTQPQRLDKNEFAREGGEDEIDIITALEFAPALSPTADVVVTLLKNKSTACVECRDSDVLAWDFLRLSQNGSRAFTNNLCEETTVQYDKTTLKCRFGKQKIYSDQIHARIHVYNERRCPEKPSTHSCCFDMTYNVTRVADQQAPHPSKGANTGLLVLGVFLAATCLVLVAVMVSKRAQIVRAFKRPRQTRTSESAVPLVIPDQSNDLKILLVYVKESEEFFQEVQNLKRAILKILPSCQVIDVLHEDTERPRNVEGCAFLDNLLFESVRAEGGGRVKTVLVHSDKEGAEEGEQYRRALRFLSDNKGAVRYDRVFNVELQKHPLRVRSPLHAAATVLRVNTLTTYRFPAHLHLLCAHVARPPPATDQQDKQGADVC